MGVSFIESHFNVTKSLILNVPKVSFWWLHQSHFNCSVTDLTRDIDFRQKIIYIKYEKRREKRDTNE